MTQSNDNNPTACAACQVRTDKRACRAPEGVGGKGCPTELQEALLAAANAEYDSPEVGEFARQASLQEAACYDNRDQRPYVMQPSKTRVQEVCEFADRMGYSRIGLAFCMGLVREALAVEEIFKQHGFEVLSVLCKAGATPKEDMGLSDEDKIFQGGFEPICNPVFQAKLLDAQGSQFNILLGLCVGHDSLFFKYAQAPTTVLAVKDRVTGHNPLAAIYLSDMYYKKLKTPPAG